MPRGTKTAPGGAYKFPGFGSRLGEGKGDGKPRCSNTPQDPRGVGGLAWDCPYIGNLQKVCKANLGPIRTLFRDRSFLGGTLLHLKFYKPVMLSWTLSGHKQASCRRYKHVKHRFWNLLKTSTILDDPEPSRSRKWWVIPKIRFL